MDCLWVMTHRVLIVRTRQRADAGVAHLLVRPRGERTRQEIGSHTALARRHQTSSSAKFEKKIFLQVHSNKSILVWKLKKKVKTRVIAHRILPRKSGLFSLHFLEPEQNAPRWHSCLTLVIHARQNTCNIRLSHIPSMLIPSRLQITRLLLLERVKTHQKKSRTAPTTKPTVRSLFLPIPQLKLFITALHCMHNHFKVKNICETCQSNLRNVQKMRQKMKI